MTKKTELKIATEIGRNVADYIYVKCHEKMWMNSCGCLRQIEQICQVPRPHLAAVEATIDEVGKEDSGSELTAKELVQKLEEWQENEAKEHGLTHEEATILKNLFEKAESLIQAQGEVEDRWIPVSERLPELNKDVLWLNKYGDMAVSCLEKGWTNLLRVQWGEAGMLELEYLTHWQPLPTPPRTKDKKEGE